MGRLSARFLFALLICAGLSSAQISLNLRVFQDDFVFSVGSGSSLALNARPGTQASLELELVYRGPGALTVSAFPELVGSNAFTIESSGAFPRVLSTNQSMRVRATYRPRGVTRVSAQLAIPLSEQLLATAPNQVVLPVLQTVLVNLFGTSPDIAVSYILPDEGNFITLGASDELRLSTVLPNAVSATTLSIANRGSGLGTLRNAVVSGDGFQLTGLPLLPLNLDAGQELRMGLRLNARPVGIYSGLLRLEFDGETRTIPLRAEVSEGVLRYELALDSGIQEIQPNTLVRIGEIRPGENLRFQVNVRNEGTLAVPINAVSVSGTAFALAEGIAARVLGGGQSLQIPIVASSPNAGSFRGRLRINTVSFDFELIATGSIFRYSYAVGDGAATVLQPSDGIFFPPATPGQVRTVQLRVHNEGSSTGSINQIVLEDAQGSFQLVELPGLPITLPPQESIAFSVRYTAQVPQSANPALRVDGARFPLVVSPLNLPPLPALQFTSTGGPVNSLEQPAVGLRLAQAYPVEVSGTLSLAQESLSFATDPSVRFINGLASVNFTVPANSTNAVFSGGNTQIRFQTGSLAGDLVLSASISSPQPAANTSNPVQTLRYTVSPAAPRILSAALSRNGNQLILQLSGIANTRSLTQLDLTLTPVQGITLTTPTLRINLEGEGLLWFRSATSQNFGGVFQISLPLNVTAQNPSASTPVRLIETIAATLSNERGQSNSVTTVAP